MADLGRRLMQVLEQEGRLDRGVEDLPDDTALAVRRGEALTRPELAVLLAYAKLALHDRLLGSPVPDDPYLRRNSTATSRSRSGTFPDAIAASTRGGDHPRRLANAIINRGGRRSSPASWTRPAPMRQTIPRPTRRRAIVQADRTQRRRRRLEQADAGRPAAAALRGAAGPADEPDRGFIRPSISTPSSRRVVGTYGSGVAEVERALEALAPAARAAHGAPAEPRRPRRAGRSRAAHRGDPRSRRRARHRARRRDRASLARRPHAFRRRGHVPARCAGQRRRSR